MQKDLKIKVAPSPDSESRNDGKKGMPPTPNRPVPRP